MSFGRYFFDFRATLDPAQVFTVKMTVNHSRPSCLSCHGYKLRFTFYRIEYFKENVSNHKKSTFKYIGRAQNEDIKIIL